MFVFLSKKLALPGGVRLRCVAWHSTGGWVACGGENGLLKVFRFREGDDDPGDDEDDEGDGGHDGEAASAETPPPPPPSRRPRSSPLHHQTLEGHGSAVVLADFCEPFGKLATADRSGLVMVWSLRSQATGQGGDGPMLWEEEAVHRAQQHPPSSSSSSKKRSGGANNAANVPPPPNHNHHPPRVTSLRWSPNGERLALAYSDGSAMVASVDGHRLWHRRITPSASHPLERVCWRPDGRVLLLAAAGAGARVTAHDALSGEAVGLDGQVTLHCCSGEQPPANVRIAALEWHWSRMVGVSGSPSLSSASSDPTTTVDQPLNNPQNQRHALLIVCFNGLLQLARGDHDDDDDDGAVCVDTGLSAPLCASWAPDGATFAVSGLGPVPGSSSSSASSRLMAPTVQLYTSAGEHLHTFRVDRAAAGGGGAAAAATAAGAAATSVMPIEGLAWEGAGGAARARLSLAVGPALLLANVRRPHLWARFGGGGGGRGGGGVIAYAAAAEAHEAAAPNDQAQRLVIAEAGALLSALDRDRRCSSNSRKGPTSGPAPPLPLLPRPRVFIKPVPCGGSTSSGNNDSNPPHSTIVNMASAGDLCALACLVGDSTAAAASGRCRLALVDAAGEAVATQALPAGASARFFAAARWGKGIGDDEVEDDQEDVFGDMDDEDEHEDEEDDAASAVVAAAGEDGGGVFVWWWRRQKQQPKPKEKTRTQCWGFHVDHLHLGQQQQQQQQHHPQHPPLCAAAAAAGPALTTPMQDHITAIALNRTGTRLLIGRESGVVAEYALAWDYKEAGSSSRAPAVELRARHLLRCCPSRLEFNSDGSLVAVIDTVGDLSLLALPPAATAVAPAMGAFVASAAPSAPPPRSSSSGLSPPGKHLAAVRHEVWDVCWSSDEPLKLAAMEREQLRVLRCPSLEPEGAGGKDDGNRCSPRRAAEERRWRRGMPHLLEYGSLRVLGIALDSLVSVASAAAGRGSGSIGGASSSSAAAAAIASAATDLLASGRAVFVHETEVLRRARVLVAAAKEEKEGLGGSSSSSSSSSSKRLAAELVALSPSSSSSAAGGNNKQQPHLHPRLSKLLADFALAQGDWAMAERALRICGDYGGVLLARRGALLLRQGGGGGGAAETVAAAEAALLRRNLAAAARDYCEADRADLAIAMWQRLGRERRAEGLLLALASSTSSGGNASSNSNSSSSRSSLTPASAELTTCWHRQARAAAEQRRWSRASKLLALCLDSGTGAGAVAAERDAVRWLHLSSQGWDRLERMATSSDRGLPDGSPLLAVLAARLRSAGLSGAAGAAGERGGGGGVA